MKSKSHQYFLPSPWGTQTSHCDSDWWVVMSHGSWVKWLMGHVGHRMWPIVISNSKSTYAHFSASCDVQSDAQYCKSNSETNEMSTPIFYCYRIKSIHHVSLL